MTGFAIQTHGLVKEFPGVVALRGLDLQVPEKSIFGFLGPNGAGKTTMLKMLVGLMKPTAGSAHIFDHDVETESMKIRSRVGYLAQSPKFYDHMSARQVLNFTAKFFVSQSEIDEGNWIDDIIKVVGLEDKADRPVGGFSGGEKQRLGIAQAQVHQPDLLILDEPAAALDPIGRRDVLKIMENLKETSTVFYSTHILDDVQRVSDQVAILNEGVLVAQGPIETILEDQDGPMFELKLKGATEHLKSHLTALDWVSSIQVQNGNDVSKWQIMVNDKEMAEKELLREIMNYPTETTIKVVEFTEKKIDLEEIFMKVVGEDTS
ncbi:MAG: ABC transporter ATP-binding protein [Candidatus Kariarchaeaceae archaeon]